MTIVTAYLLPLKQKHYTTHVNNILCGTLEITAGRAVESTVTVEPSRSVERLVALIITSISSCIATHQTTFSYKPKQVSRRHVLNVP